MSVALVPYREFPSSRAFSRSYQPLFTRSCSTIIADIMVSTYVAGTVSDWSFTPVSGRATVLTWLEACFAAVGMTVVSAPFHDHQESSSAPLESACEVEQLPSSAPATTYPLVVPAPSVANKVPSKKSRKAVKKAAVQAATKAALKVALEKAVKAASTADERAHIRYQFFEQMRDVCA